MHVQTDQAHGTQVTIYSQIQNANINLLSRTHRCGNKGLRKEGGQLPPEYLTFRQVYDSNLKLCKKSHKQMQQNIL